MHGSTHQYQYYPQIFLNGSYETYLSSKPNTSTRFNSSKITTDYLPSQIINDPVLSQNATNPLHSLTTTDLLPSESIIDPLHSQKTTNLLLSQATTDHLSSPEQSNNTA